MSNTTHTLTIAFVHGRHKLTKTYFRDGSGKVRRREADLGSHFNFWDDAEFRSIECIEEYARLVSNDPRACFIRGVVADGIPKNGRRRRLLKEDDPESTLISAPDGRVLIIVDRDNFELPGGVNPLTDPEGVIRVARDTMGDPAFHGAACVGVLSSSAGVAKVKQADGTTAYRKARPDEPQVGRARLFFVADRPITDSTLRSWLECMGEPDTSSGDPIQYQYVAAPIFEDGLTDPIPERIFRLDGEPVVTVPDHIETPDQERARLAAEEQAREDERIAREALREARREDMRLHPERYEARTRQMDWRNGFDGLGFVRALGLRVGRKRGTKYPCECPNAAQHTGGTGKGNDSSTVLIHKPDGSWQLKCLHANCRDTVNLFELCQENPDIADEYATQEWIPAGPSLTSARHARFRNFPQITASATPAQVAHVDRLLAIELELAIAEENARAEAEEADRLADLAAFLTRESCTYHCANDCPADAPLPIPRADDDRESAISHNHEAADYALAHAAPAAYDRLVSARRSIGICQRGVGSRFSGPAGTFNVPHRCGRCGDCPDCARHAAAKWTERVVWGGLENLERFHGGRLVMYSIPATTRTAEAAYQELALEADRNIKRAVARRDGACCTIYEVKESEPGDGQHVAAQLHVLAILPASASDPASVSPSAWSIPVVNAPMADPGDSPESPRRSQYWLATATIGAWIGQAQDAVGLLPWLAPSAKVRAEKWLAGEGRKQWRAVRASRSFSQTFPELDPEYTREGEYVDAEDVDRRVARGDMTIEQRRAVADVALKGIDRRVDAIETLPAENQPVPLALSANLNKHIALLAAWRAATLAGDRKKAKRCRDEYRKAIEQNRDELMAWKGGQGQGAGTVAGSKAENGASPGGGSCSPLQVSRLSG